MPTPTGAPVRGRGARRRPALHDRDLLQAPEPAVAAEHFAFLIVGKSIDQALFYGGPHVLAGIDIASYVRSGVGVFLAGYRPQAKAR